MGLAQYREMQSLEQFGENLDEVTKSLLKRGRVLTEILIQPQSSPVPLKDLKIELINIFEKRLYEMKNKSSIFEPIFKSLQLNNFSDLPFILLISRVLISM